MTEITQQNTSIKATFSAMPKKKSLSILLTCFSLVKLERGVFGVKCVPFHRNGPFVAVGQELKHLSELNTNQSSVHYLCSFL